MHSPLVMFLSAMPAVGSMAYLASKPMRSNRLLLRVVADALAQGRLKSWDHQPFVDASQQYMRNHIDLDDLERRARFPQP